jgi:hypothetical protein
LEGREVAQFVWEEFNLVAVTIQSPKVDQQADGGRQGCQIISVHLQCCVTEFMVNGSVSSSPMEGG